LALEADFKPNYAFPVAGEAIAVYSKGMSDPHINTERLTAAFTLSVIGGFLDIYTFLFRGEVFANAVTGNMVLFALHLAKGEWQLCGKYLLPIFFYALGVFAAEWISGRAPVSRRYNWHQLVIALEFLCLVPVVFVPFGEWDYAVNSLISFVCALQVQTFRRIQGLPFASTMCTGNLRSGAEAMFRALTGHNREELQKALRYFGVIGVFISGAAAGALILTSFGHYALLIAPAGLAAVFFLIAPGARRSIFSKNR